MTCDTRGAYGTSVRLGTNYESSFTNYFRLYDHTILSYCVIHFLVCSILFESPCICD